MKPIKSHELADKIAKNPKATHLENAWAFLAGQEPNREISHKEFCTEIRDLAESLGNHPMLLETPLP